jgi:predicted transcriptional regulator
VKVKELLDEGCSHSEIERTTGVTRNTIRRHFPGTAWTWQQIQEMSAAKRRYNSIMKSNGVDSTLVV